MSDLPRNDDLTPAGTGDRLAASAGRPLRMVREPNFTGREVLAYVVIVVMVCGPLALGAFRL